MRQDSYQTVVTNVVARLKHLKKSNFEISLRPQCNLTTSSIICTQLNIVKFEFRTTNLSIHNSAFGFIIHTSKIHIYFEMNTLCHMKLKQTIFIDI